MAGLITVRLSRNDSQPWGFRLQGGKDFGAPLLVQKVNGGSLAEKAGLQVADAIIKVNGQEVFNLRHKEAQDVIVKAGSSFEVIVSRSPGGLWKPAVTPVGNLPAPSPVGGAPAAVTKTSLAYKGPASPAISSGHNLSARPFNASPQLNGVGDQGSVKTITSKQYNNPVGLYSEQAIAETLSAQTEVLTTGALGVNFMKNEKTYNSNNSEVLKMVQEIDNEPREPEPVEPPSPAGGAVVPPPAAVSGLRHVSAPIAPAAPAAPTPQSPALQPGQNICADCERLIIGVFVRIKDKNLHVECFKCATCGTSLKNVGYYNINQKLYCDIHAKLVARSNPPAPNLEPVTVPPGGRIPSGVIPAPQVSAAVQSPQPGTMAPLPFHAPRMRPSHVSAPYSYKPPTSSVSAPKPFSGPAAPAPAVPASVPFSPSTFSPAPPPPAPAPISAPAVPPFKQPSISAPVPPPFKQPPISAPAPPPFKPPSTFPKNLPGDQVKEIEDIACCLDKSKRMSVCSSEVCDLSEKKVILKAMDALQEDPSRASPIPFVRGEIVSEQFQASTQGAVKKSENFESAEEGNVQVTRKTKVEESFQRTQKMYTAEVTSSSQSSTQMRAASPEMEQIMAKRRAQMAYDSPDQTPTTFSSQYKHLQSERCLTPEMENLMNKPHGTWSPMPPACMVRPSSPNQIVSFPPDMPLPPLPSNVTHPRTATPEQFQEARETVERFVDHSKHVQQSHSVSSGRNNQTYNQQTAFSSHSQQQYTPRFDASQGFSPYVPKSNGNNKPNNDTDTGNSSESQQNGYQKNGINQNYNDNGNYRNQEQSQPSDEKDPKVEEPDDSEEKRSEKEEKSQRNTTFEEEESSRRVFSDFGGPQVLSSVDIESTLEGGIEKTSVKKSQKTQYASCEFETSRKSAVHQHDKNSTFAPESSEEKNSDFKPSKEVPPPSEEKEETMTKSQVEEIIKKELNKVFQMAQTMEKTDYSQIYKQQSQAEQHFKHENEHKSVGKQKSKVEQKAISSQYDVITKTGRLTSGLTTAPARSFTPQPLENNYPLPYQSLPSDFPPPRPHPEPPAEKPGYIPITGGRDSPLVKALTIACDRPYSPVPMATAPEPLAFATQPTRSSMLEALTTAPITPFQMRPPSETLGLLTESKQTQKLSETKYESVQKYALKPVQADFKPISANTITSQKASQQVTEELKSAFQSTSKVQSSFASSESKHTENMQQRILSAPKQVERSITPSGLHAPNLLPYYQQNIGEIPLAHRSNSPIPHQIKAPSVTPPRAQSVPRQGERRGSVKALSEAYIQQVAAQQTSPVVGTSSSSVSYVSAGAYGKGSSVTKTYSYQQEHKSIDSASYQASPLAGKLPLAGDLTMPKCSSPVLGKLDHTKQVFKPAIPTQQPTTVFRSPVAEQANLKQAPPYFVEEKDKTHAPWVVVKDKEDEGHSNKVCFKPTQPATTPKVTLPSRIFNLPNVKPTPSLNNTPAELPKPASLPGVTKPLSLPDVGPGASKGSATSSTSAPRRGRGVLNAAVTAGGRVPLCGSCNNQIRGPFITALGKIWCPEHFVCVNANCRRPLQDIGFVEDAQGLYCEFCFEQYLAPACSKCNAKIKGDCLNAIGKHFHPECFTCAYCGKLFGNSPFFLEDALPYCEADWNELFTTKCFSCGFPIEAGDRWVEALNNNYHSQCFNCTMCKKNLEGQSFFAKGGRPFCKTHAR